MHATGAALSTFAVMDLTGMAPSSWGGRASSNERQGILAWTTAPSAAEVAKSGGSGGWLNFGAVAARVVARRPMAATYAHAFNRQA